MRLSRSLLLLAALTSTTLARHGHHAHHDNHLRRGVGTTSTITTTDTVVVCPCDSSTSTLAPLVPSSTPSTSVEVSPTTSSTFTTLPSTSTSTTTSTAANPDWTATPSNDEYSTAGFGGVTNSTGSGVTYKGNVGIPYGSNIIEVSASTASSYKYVVQFSGSNTEDWTIVIWNKIGPDGKMDGWYNNACHQFTLSPGATKYYAFDEDSQGGWAAASGSSIPIDNYGGYAATWGEFDFGSGHNTGWSGFDVSAIQAQNAGLEVQGMKICSVLVDGTCSVISAGLGSVQNAYTEVLAKVDGLGGNLPVGPVRLAVEVDYKG